MVPGCPMCRVNIDESKMEMSNFKGIEGKTGSARTKENLE
jgi:heterodisulfide reductase subunit B